MNKNMSEENNDGIKLEDQMSEEERTALQENEDFILNFKEEDIEDPDKQAELAKRLRDAKTTVHQKRHFREKVAELSTQLEEAKKPKTTEEKKPEKKKDESTETTSVNPIVALTFRQDHPEVPKAVVQEILEYAGAKKISPEEALKKSFFQTMIKEEKDKEDVDGATLTPGRKGTPAGGAKDWSTASEAEIIAERNKTLGQG